ncbi:M6 family metalloprotease domain-containing protein [Kitasatospora indigofera]|uniref:M6 family metalloprotease domain-containing protein n=1 Tax=Kitasatospora indigofera TaxID=67307 RepID=UPI00363353C1
MSAIFGEILTFTQQHGGDVALATIGDDKYARYETVDGFSVVYDESREGYCYADVDGPGPGRRFRSTGVRISERPPKGLRRHLKEGQEYRRLLVKERSERAVPQDRLEELDPDGLFTFGANRGLLLGDRLSEGDVQGLTILVTFPGTSTTVTPADVDAMLNGPDYHANGNHCSVREFFRAMSSDRLRFGNTVVGPFQMSRSRLTYANNEGLLAPEAIAAAVDAGVDFSRFDSQGRGIVDSICVLYAGPTEFAGDLWPHSTVFSRDVGQGMRTQFHTVTSMGRTPAEQSIGTFCHESGHLLCRWPDLYDYGKIEREGDDFTSAGLGSYCVMGAGNHLGNGRKPSPVCVYLRRLVGWCATDVDIATPGTYQAKHADYDTALIYQNPDREDAEYYLVENRSRIDFDEKLTSDGLAVYHCDIKGSNEFQQGSLLHHYQCALLQADGHLDLETNANQGDGGDLYGPTEGTAVSHSSRPASTWWDGGESGLTISGIGAPGPVISFRTGEQSTGGAAVSGSSTPQALIPELDPGGLTDAITLQGAGTVRELAVTIDIEHPRIGDLRVVLMTPSGRRAVLHNRSGGNTKNLLLKLDSRPPSALAPLTGDAVTGSWKLKITDSAQPGAGTLRRWELKVRTAG